MLIEKSDLTVGFNVNLDLTGATTNVVSYRSPAGEGTLTPTVDDAVNGVMHVHIGNAINSVPGQWILWATINKGGVVYKTSAATFRVYPEGVV